MLVVKIFSCKEREGGTCKDFTISKTLKCYILITLLNGIQLNICVSHTNLYL